MHASICQWLNAPPASSCHTQIAKQSVKDVEVVFRCWFYSYVGGASGYMGGM